MIKLTKAQQDQITALCIGTVGLLAAVWWFGVKSSGHDLLVARQQSADMQKKLHDAEAVMRRSEEIGDTLKTESDLLSKREATLAPDRDSYAWVINTVNNFIQSRKGINFDSYGGQPTVGENGMIAKFPYKWATFQLRGSGYYDDIGKFLADFENTFPYFFIQNLNLSVNSGPAVEPEKLTVTFELVAPVVASSDTK
jgi:hypothetical protein